MDGEVARTLAELERKLQELELALATASRKQAPTSGNPSAGDASQPTSGARLVDEDLEGAATTSTPAGDPHLTSPATTSTPSQATPAPDPQATPAPDPQATSFRDLQARPIFTPPATPGSTPTMPVPGPPAAAPVSPPSPADDSIELAELSRFRDRLEEMTRELVADYERVIRLRRSGHGQPPDESV